jgi:hypothetical protein
LADAGPNAPRASSEALKREAKKNWIGSSSNGLSHAHTRQRALFVAREDFADQLLFVRWRPLHQLALLKPKPARVSIGRLSINLELGTRESSQKFETAQRSPQRHRTPAHLEGE